VASNIANLERGRPHSVENKNRQICPFDNETIEQSAPKISQSRAAEMLNVSHRTVKHAVQVREHGTLESRQAVTFEVRRGKKIGNNSDFN
jgi:hypothetical protein